MNKKYFIAGFITLIFAQTNFSQVGIGTTTPHPSSQLDITSITSGILIPRMNTGQRAAIPSPATGLQVFDTDTKSFWFYNSAAWVELSSGSATNQWSVNGSNMYNNNNGNVGIGTTNPTNQLQIGSVGASGFATNQLALGNGTNAFAIYQTNAITQMGSTTDISIMPKNNGMGYVGINTLSPRNSLQIGDLGSSNYFGFDLVIANAFGSMAFFQGSPSFFQTLNSGWISTGDIALLPGNNVGINTFSPTNKLQIGSVGATGFATNDLAIGNGTHAMAIYLTNASTLIGSTNDIILKPRNNLRGRVGINTESPRAPLHVSDHVDISSFYSYHNFNSYRDGIQNCGPCTAGVSIYANRAVLAEEFNAFSDARIKDIVGVSSTSKDLETLNALQVTDYTLKDKVKSGYKPFKKVIAQDVEKVYPQVVSKNTDFIPNVYQVSRKVEKTADGYLLSFTSDHNISNVAKKLRVLCTETEGMEEANIVSIPSSKQVIINTGNLKSDKVFVYGEEVNDFRTVDYEGLTTLNISATQELSKLIKAQQACIDAQGKKIAQLTEIVNSLKNKNSIAAK